MNQSLFVLTHHIVLDLEGYYIDFAGEVTADSVHCGHGGQEGLSVIKFLKGDLNKNVRSPQQQLRRMIQLHEHFLEWILGDAMIKKLRRQVWNIVVDTDGLPRSASTGRLMSMSDSADHCGCKNGMGIRYNHPSRSISVNPFCDSEYTTPRANETNWDRDIMRPIYRRSLEAYLKLPKSELEVPCYFTADGARHWTTEDLVALTTKESILKGSKQKGLHDVTDVHQSTENDE